VSSSQLQGLLILVFGTVCVVFAERFGTQASEFQRRFFGVDFKPRWLQLGYLVGGMVFCLVGGLAVIGVVEFRQ
jgi:hypothetical protein